MRVSSAKSKRSTTVTAIRAFCSWSSSSRTRTSSIWCSRRYLSDKRLCVNERLITKKPRPQINGGQLLTRIQEHVCFSEHEAAQIIKEIASGLNFLHKKGIAHRDLKPENILCVDTVKLFPIKICDFDLGSGIKFTTSITDQAATPQLLTPVSYWEGGDLEGHAVFSERGEHFSREHAQCAVFYHTAEMFYWAGLGRRCWCGVFVIVAANVDKLRISTERVPWGDTRLSCIY